MKLVGGFYSEEKSFNIYFEKDKFFNSEGLEITKEELEMIVNNLFPHNEEDKEFRLFKYDNHNYYCECIVDNSNYEVFVCGTGVSMDAAFQNCILNLYDLKAELGE